MFFTNIFSSIIFSDAVLNTSAPSWHDMNVRYTYYLSLTPEVDTIAVNCQRGHDPYCNQSDYITRLSGDSGSESHYQWLRPKG